MFTIEAKTLSNALSLVSASAERKVTIPILAFVLVESMDDGKIRLTRSDIDTAIQAEVATIECDDFAWCVPAVELSDLVKLMSGDVVLDEFKGRVNVSAGSTKQKLPMRPRQDFPMIESADDAIGEISGELLAKMLTTALLGAETNPNGVEWQKNLELIAKDGCLTITGCTNPRISSVSVPFDGVFEAVLPVRGAEVLASFAKSAESVTIALSDNLFTLRSPQGAAHSRLSSLKMADWRMVVAAEYQHQIEVDPSLALLSLRRALLASDNGAVNMFLGKDAAILASSNADTKREGQETLPIQCSTLNGATHDIRVLGEQLAEYFKLCDGPVLWQVNEGQSAMRFTLKQAGEFDWQYIQTTLKLK